MRNRNTVFALNLTLIVVGMLGLAFASVPLYRLFCDITGYGGTTRAAQIAPGARGRSLTVTFNADIDPALPWRFKPSQNSLTLAIGEERLAHYVAENLSDAPVTGRAVYNVTPFAAGRYFNKIECFCFIEQTLEPNQRVDMPVLFYIDPAIENDPELASLSTITLSYTFFPVQTDFRSTSTP